MGFQADGLWWLVTLVTSVVGMAMFVYGVRQKEPLPLVFGFVFGLVPMFASTGLGATAVSIGLGVLYYVMRNYMG